MTLAEKILSLRTQRGMSQDDLAEKMEVSRQSVSKWETAQSTPDLDKIIKLANLFGVTVDELVRDGEAPQPPEPPQPQVIYVEREKRGLTPVQTLGVIFEVTGAALAILGIMGAPVLILPAVALVVLGLPLLLARKHPFLIAGWLAVALVIFATWRPVNAMWGSYLFGLLSWAYLYIPGLGRRTMELFKMLPYLVTIAVLIFISLRKKRENQPPASLGLPYFREER